MSAILRLRLLARPLLLAVVCAAPGAADVLVVDPGGGTPYQDVQAAIDAASEGDTVLVKSGTYTGVLINDKGVDLIADAGENVAFDGVVRVINLAAGKRVLLDGIRADGFASITLFAGHGLLLSNNQGAVRAQDCTFVGANNLVGPPNCQGLGDQSGWEGAIVLSSADVALTGCTLTGGNGVIQRNDDVLGPDDCGFVTPGGQGGFGVEATGSNVALYGCQVTGGAGGYGGSGGTGGDAVRATGGSLLLSGSSLQGGGGGVGFDFFFGDGGPGGHGVRAFTSLQLRHVGSTLAGGPGGISALFQNGAPGQPVFGPATVQAFPGAARSLDVASPVRVGEVFSLDFAGEPFDLVLFMVSGQDLFLTLPALAGILLQLPVVTIDFGLLDAQGQLSLPLALNPFGASSEVFVLQALHVGTGLELRLGNARHLVALAASI